MKDVKKTAVTSPVKDAQKPIGKTNDLGVIKISDSVVASLVHRAVTGVDGVSRLTSTFVDDIAEIVGRRKSSSRAINISMEEDRVDIEVKINIKFGFKVPDVAAQVQTAVIESVENTTGMNVSSVNVIVQEIEDPIEVKEEDVEMEPAADLLDEAK